MKENEKSLYKGFKNQLSIIGRLDTIPEGKFLGRSIKIELVTLHPIKNSISQKMEEHSEAHTVVLKNGLVEFFFEHARKGMMFFAEGPIQTQFYEETDGRVFQTVELIAEVFGPLDSHHVVDKG